MVQLIRRTCVFASLLLTTSLGLGAELLASPKAEARIPFNPPSTGAPIGRGGASRGDATCSPTPSVFSRQFIPLTPAQSNSGLTVRPHPTLLAYVPPSSASTAFFSLKDENGRIHYQTTVPLSKGGVVKITIPQSARPLALGKQYSWGLAVLCSGELGPNSPFVTSWIQRVPPSAQMAAHLSQSASIEQATLYGTQGIWYDTLATLFTLKQQQPGDVNLRSTWRDLLSAVGLSEVAAEPTN